MTTSINNLRGDRRGDQRAQQRAQGHLNYQAAHRATSPRRPAEAQDVFAHTADAPLPAIAYAQRSRPVNARTLLTASTFLALLAGGRFAAAFADAPMGPSGALEPACNRRGRRAAEAPSTAAREIAAARNRRTRRRLQDAS